IAPATHIPGAKRWPIRPLLRGKEARVPVSSNTVIGRPGGDVSAGCQWLIAAAEMAGVAPCDWFASPGGDALEWARSPITVQTLNMGPEAVRAGRALCTSALRRAGVVQRCGYIPIVVSWRSTKARRPAMRGVCP